jgi:PTS system mannose-specific IIA component
MSTALLFITHEGIASNLLSIGKAIRQQPSSNLSYIEVPMDSSTDDITKQIDEKLASLNIDNGIIFITDIFGSTPSNIAQQFASKYKAPLISGVNLPMVVRLLNYREEQPEALLQKALDGARLGIQNHHTETKV